MKMLTTFQHLLEASLEQPEPQRLLFVFTRIELPESATAAQRELAMQKGGGHLVPSLVVDKTPDEIDSFASLVAESTRTGEHWDIVFVGSLPGRGGIAPNADEAEQPLHFMVNAINEGRISEFAAFDRDGDALQFF